VEESLLHEIFGVSKSYYSSRTEVRHGGVFVSVHPRDSLYRCPECRSREVIRKGKRVRRVQTLPIGFHPVYLEVEVPRCRCTRCGRLFEIAPPFASPTPNTPKRSADLSMG
jgi:transposase